jgi:hypothetical protein
MVLISFEKPFLAGNFADKLLLLDRGDPEVLILVALTKIRHSG